MKHYLGSQNSSQNLGHHEVTVCDLCILILCVLNSCLKTGFSHQPCQNGGLSRSVSPAFGIEVFLQCADNITRSFSVLAQSVNFNIILISKQYFDQCLYTKITKLTTTLKQSKCFVFFFFLFGNFPVQRLGVSRYSVPHPS